MNNIVVSINFLPPYKMTFFCHHLEVIFNSHLRYIFQTHFSQTLLFVLK